MEIVISVIVDSKVTNGHVEWAEYTSAHSLLKAVIGRMMMRVNPVRSRGWMIEGNEERRRSKERGYHQRQKKTETLMNAANIYDRTESFFFFYLPSPPVLDGLPRSWWWRHTTITTTTILRKLLLNIDWLTDLDLLLHWTRKHPRWKEPQVVRSVSRRECCFPSSSPSSSSTTSSCFCVCVCVALLAIVSRFTLMVVVKLAH